MKVELKEIKKIELLMFLDFDGTFSVENEDITELLNESEEILLIDKKQPIISTDYALYDFIYIKFKKGSRFMNCLYIGTLDV